ncbi:MAG: hypothetical protein P0Y55_02345 [Candidatus Cohnella colombiensis]|uniref:Uncharacterized protein n=1 Tax=Candidatus Cohnella colombiensis TaxID=3121368 RepID=A0AA95EWV7_9BACL|nr:MAG: hypothetical protein P0Y55_02345 [Cohnella sp.]
MVEVWKSIGEHVIRFQCIGPGALRFLEMMFGNRPDPEEVDKRTAYTIRIEQGCTMNDGKTTTVSQTRSGCYRFERPDYELVIQPDFRETSIRFYDFMGLRSVLVNWYSALITYLDWGVVIHSSSLVHNGEGYLFAGLSGAGKSTVARLSLPRPLLSDEASIVKLDGEGQLRVYDSPLRSDLLQSDAVRSVPLKGIYLLQQAPQINAYSLDATSALMSIFDKVWYFPYETTQSMKLVRLCKRLIERVPIYRLEFQNNDAFWEAIS